MKTEKGVSPDITLPKPTEEMSAAEKGRLLVEYLRRGINVERMDFNGCLVEAVDLVDANMAGVNIENSEFVSVVLRGADFSKARAERAIFRDVTFKGANFTWSHFREARLVEAEMDGCTLSHADFVRADMRTAIVRGAVAECTGFEEADLSYVDFSNSTMTEARFHGSTLDGTKFVCTDLSDAYFDGAKVFSTNYMGATLTGCRFAWAKIDAATYKASCWSPEFFVSLRQPQLIDGRKYPGIDVVEPDEFPDTVRSAIFGLKQGLTLYFNTKITPFDRFLVDGVITRLPPHVEWTA